MPRTYYRTPPYERVTRRLKLSKEGCLEFQGSRTNYGYGKVSSPGGGAPLTAHRVVYEHDVGGLQEDEIVLHTCDNPSCCNPQHLRKGTKADNTADMVSKKRHQYGEARWNHKLTEDQVREIRKDSRSGRELGRAYGVSRSQIYRVKNRQRWKEVS